MKNMIWSVGLLMLTVLCQKANADTLIVAPGSNPASLYVNSQVGTTVRFPSSIMLVVPTRYFTVKRESNRFLQIKAKSFARRETVTVELVGGKDLHFQLIPSKQASKYLKIQLAGKTKGDRRTKLLQAMTTSNAVTGVVSEEISGSEVELQGIDLEPRRAYHLPPYTGISFSKSESKAFDTSKTTIGTPGTKVWSADLKDEVLFIIENQKSFNPLLLGKTLRGIKQ